MCSGCSGNGCDCECGDDPDLEDEGDWCEFCNDERPCDCDSQLQDEDDPAEDEDRPIDQIHCKDCGRPMIIWADIPGDLTEEQKTCARCKQGLAPEWEY